MYYGVLNMVVLDGTNVVALADGLAVVTVAKRINEIEGATNEAVRKSKIVVAKHRTASDPIVRPGTNSTPSAGPSCSKLLTKERKLPQILQY